MMVIRLSDTDPWFFVPVLQQVKFFHHCNLIHTSIMNFMRQCGACQGGQLVEKENTLITDVWCLYLLIILVELSCFHRIPNGCVHLRTTVLARENYSYSSSFVS